MKKIIFLLAAIVYSLTGYSQAPVEVLAGNRQIHYINYWQKNIDSAGKFNVFNLNRYAIDLKDKAFNNFAIESQFTYQLQPWFGIAAGGAYRGEQFVPTVGLSLAYANKKGDFFVQAYPTIELVKPVSFSMFALAGYTPKINQRWGFFSQLIISSSMDVEKTPEHPERKIAGLFTVHRQSTQLLRIGLNYSERFQFGVGADFNQLYLGMGNFNNYGLFFRLQL